MEHREIKTPEQIAELKLRSPGGYRNLRESVINELPVLGTPTTATSGRSLEFRKGSNPNPVEFVEDLLRTPSVVDSTGGAISESQARERGRMVKVSDQVAELAFDNGLQVSESIAASLLPTPAVGHIRNHDEPIENYLQRRQDFVDGKTKGMPGASLGVAVRMEMLPTVTVQDGKNNGGPSQFERNTLPLNAQVMDETNWGKFEPAIRRWESLTRPAPSPTKPDGKDGNHRLSAEFTEWMMGLPEGWVTAEDIGLKRNDQLKACGNGVVPQQAELALRMLLQGLQIEFGGGKIAMLPTPTVSDTYTDNLKSSQQKEGSMHSVTLPQAIRQITKD
jgi:hypothetical protein